MNWYYSKNGAQQGPVTEVEVQTLIDQGTLANEDLIWRDGMSEWQPLASVSEFQLPIPASTGGNLYQSSPSAGRAYSQPGGFDVRPWQGLMDNAKWIKFFGIVMIVVGVPYCLALVGIVYIFIGLWLTRAAKALELLKTQPNVETAHEVGTELGKFFKAVGIMTIIGLIFMALFIVAIIVIFIFGGAMAAAGINR